ncbi:MAG: amphi-Trp domain-containing protein [Haloferacaceae archaeon]
MDRDTGFEAWFTASRDDAATLLQNLGDGLADGHIAWETISVPVSEAVDVEVECEPEGDRYEFEISMEWEQDGDVSRVEDEAEPASAPDDTETGGEDGAAAGGPSGHESADDEGVRLDAGDDGADGGTSGASGTGAADEAPGAVSFGADEGASGAEEEDEG